MKKQKLIEACAVPIQKCDKQPIATTISEVIDCVMKEYAQQSTPSHDKVMEVINKHLFILQDPDLVDDICKDICSLSVVGVSEEVYIECDAEEAEFTLVRPSLPLHCEGYVRKVSLNVQGECNHNSDHLHGVEGVVYCDQCRKSFTTPEEKGGEWGANVRGNRSWRLKERKKCKYKWKHNIMRKIEGRVSCKFCGEALSPPTLEDKLIGYIDYISELISYIALLGKELNETASLAHIHGWRTTRHEEGEKARAKLDELAKSLLLPPLKAALKDLPPTPEKGE